MHDQDTIDNFIGLRSKGLSYAKIADTLRLSKTTVVLWSRKYHYQIQNLRVIEMEAIAERAGTTRTQRTEIVSNYLYRIDQELARRDLTTVSTARLLELARRHREELAHINPGMAFTAPISEIPAEELPQQSLDWQA